MTTHADPIAGAVAKLARVFPLDGERFRELGESERAQAQVHHMGERCRRPPPASQGEGAPKVRQWTFDPEKFYTLRVTSDCTRRYTVELLATGTKVQFVVLAGQDFIVTGTPSDVKITIDEVEPAVAGEGLQLVPRVAGEGER